MMKKAVRVADGRMSGADHMTLVCAGLTAKKFTKHEDRHLVITTIKASPTSDMQTAVGLYISPRATLVSKNPFPISF